MRRLPVIAVLLAASAAHAGAVNDIMKRLAKIKQFGSTFYGAATYSADNTIVALIETPKLHKVNSDWLLASVAQHNSQQACNPLVDTSWKTSSQISNLTCQPVWNLDDCTNNSSACAGSSCIKFAFDQSKQYCAGHSDAELLEPIYQIVSQAKKQVTITSLKPPDGRFFYIIRKALLDNGTSGLKVRLLFGNCVGKSSSQGGEYCWDVQAFAKNLLTGVSKSMTIDVAKVMSARLSGWNHSKIVAADGTHVMVGGINLFSNHYLDSDGLSSKSAPVFDMAIRVDGSAANSAELFADELWAIACREMKSQATNNKKKSGVDTWTEGYSHGSNGFAALDYQNACPDAFGVKNSSSAIRNVVIKGNNNKGSTSILGVGRLSWAHENAGAANASDIALPALIGSAKKTLNISQQDLGQLVKGTPYFWTETIDAIVERAADTNMKVRIFLSPDKGGPEGKYTWGDGEKDVKTKLANALLSAMKKKNGSLGKKDKTVIDAYCNRLEVKYADLPAYSKNSGVVVGNHTKVISVDGTHFYVGSQNLYGNYDVTGLSVTTQNYVNDLAEFGFIVEDGTTTGKVDGIFDVAWAEAKQVAPWSKGSNCAVP